MAVNVYAAWIGFLLGVVAGAVPGLFFYDAGWLGGYASWQRRMLRLGHIAFFGLGLINLAFGLTVKMLNLNDGVSAAGSLLLTGAITMPAVCYMSAWRPVFRNLFFIPVASVAGGIVLFLWRMMKL